MVEYKRLALLIIIMIGVAFVVGATAIGVIYDQALERERARLVNIAQSQARLMEAFARLEATAPRSEQPTTGALSEILEAHRRLREQVIGQTAELQLARREGHFIVYLTPARSSHQPHDPVAFGGPLGEPMTAALSGRSGTMIGHDYGGRRVLAAFEHVPELGLGLVAKIDITEINQSYLRAGVIAALLSLAAVLGASMLFLRVSEPIVRRLRESENRYRELFDNMDIGVAVYKMRGHGKDFVLEDFNRAGEQIAKIRRQELIGRSLTEMFPGVREFGLVEVMSRVWRTGKSERLPTSYYRDERIEGWRDLYVYKLPSAEVVILFSDVSERERQADALRQSEQRYRNLVEDQPDPICQFLPDTTLTFVNRAYADFYGCEPEELIGERWLDFAARDDRPRFLEELTSVTPEDPQRHEETRTTRVDHEVRWFLCHLYGFFDDAGNVMSFQTFSTDITPHKRAEEQLAQQLGLLTAITDSAADAIFVSDGEDRVTLMNPAAERIFGWSRQELMGRKLHQVIHDRHPDGRPYPASECPLSRTSVTGETLFGHEDVFFRKDGSLVQVSCSNAPLVIKDRIAGSVLVAHDISDRKRTEAALRESETRIRALLDASQDEILLVSVDGEVLAINKAAERRLAKRTSGTDPVGTQLDRLLPPDQAAQRMAIVRQVATTATLVHCEVTIHLRCFEFWFYPVLHAERSVSEVAVYAREITEQKKSQAELGKLFQAIRQSPMSVVITDREGKIEYVNPEFTRVTGYTLAEAVGQNAGILKSGHTRCEQYSELWATISSGGVWRGEFLNKKKNGELFWELACIAPVNDGDKITNFVAVKEDITERKEIEDQLRQSQKMQAVGQLTGGIAHDFNNLLSIVMGNLQLLQPRVSGDARAQEYLDDALWAARRGGELTHRLLAFARKQPLKPAVIDLNEVVRGLADLLRRTLGASVHIEESLASDLWKAFADRGELERALVNLAVNSRDAMRSGGMLTLETHNAVLDQDYADQHEEVTPGQYVLLAVADTGTGMSPEIVQQVFEPFFTTKGVGQGSGLGLSMVYGFVKQTGGHISVYSRVGQGTCVKLYLPRAPSSLVGREEESPEVFPEHLGNKIVLIVEDEARLRKVAVTMLERLGLQSLQAETAKDALELLADTHVDVLFTDIELPGGMNGTELADAAHHLYPELKVLFTTGYARETTLHKRGLHESAPWLLKPYSHQGLARALKKLLTPVAD